MGTMFETGSGCVLEGVRFFVATEFQMFLSFFAAPLQGADRRMRVFFMLGYSHSLPQRERGD